MKRILGNVLIIILAAAALFQTFYLWNGYGYKAEEIFVKEEFKSEDMARKVLSPRVVVLSLIHI